MVKGFESFKKWFQGCENQYTIIGGTACYGDIFVRGNISIATKAQEFRNSIDSVNQNRMSFRQ